MRSRAEGVAVRRGGAGSWTNRTNRMKPRRVRPHCRFHGTGRRLRMRMRRRASKQHSIPREISSGRSRSAPKIKLRPMSCHKYCYFDFPDSRDSTPLEMGATCWRFAYQGWKRVSPITAHSLKNMVKRCAAASRAPKR